MTVSPLRVCLVAPLPPPYGGIGNWTMLVRRHAQSRFDVDLQIVDIAPRWRAIDDMAVFKRAIGGGIQLVRDILHFLYILRTRPTVVHLTTSGELAIVRDLVVLAIARLLQIPSVYHLRFGRVSQIATANTSEWRTLVKAIQLTRVVIAIDASTEATLKQRFPALRVLRIPNGIDINELPSEVPQSTVQTILFLGWVLPSKGVAELVQAWTKTRLKGWRCVIAGPGSETYRVELRERFQPELLEFLPEQSHADAMSLIAASDVFVLPSHTEGFPNVIIEAMALGKPIIATDVGAISDMLSGGCGMVIPPRDVMSLIDALYELCSNEVLREEMGARAQVKARTEYSMDKVMERLMSIWRGCDEAL